MTPTPRTDPRTGPWPRRLAWAAALSAVPLFLFGGSVTTLGAGMAVEGWLVAEGHFLLVFPVDKWFRDLPTFVEHTHRLFGALVGLFAIASVVAARHHPDRGARWLTRAALVAVVGQGALGGFRVLENDPQLAFLHGVSAQAVFALLWVAALAVRDGGARERSGELGRWSAVAGLAVFVQVTLGAWYRHGLRPEVTAGAPSRLSLHLFGALVVLGLVAALVARLRASDRPRSELAPLQHLLGVQIGLGFAAWAGFRPGSVGALEWLASVGHVLVGALLLAHCAGLAWRHGLAREGAALAAAGARGGDR